MYKDHLMKNLSLFLLLLCASFSGVTQDLNLSFEKVDSISSQRILPVNWKYLGEQSIIRDSQHGLRALQINSYYGYYHTDCVLTDGNDIPLMDLTGIGVPFSKSIKSVSGWFKYQNVRPDRVNIDSGQVIVFLRKYLESEKKSIVVGQGEARLGKTEAYTEFRLPIQQILNLDPDTIVIMFSTLIKRKINPNGGIERVFNLPSACAGMPNSRCLYLTIDDLSLQFTTPTKNPRASLQPLQISPNPADDKTLISWELPTPSGEVELSLSDVVGRIIKRIQTNQNQLEVNTIDLPKGIYLVHLRQAGQLIGIERLSVVK